MLPKDKGKYVWLYVHMETADRTEWTSWESEHLNIFSTLWWNPFSFVYCKIYSYLRELEKTPNFWKPLMIHQYLTLRWHLSYLVTISSTKKECCLFFNINVVNIAKWQPTLLHWHVQILWKPDSKSILFLYNTFLLLRYTSFCNMFCTRLCQKFNSGYFKFDTKCTFKKIYANLSIRQDTAQQ